MIDEYADNLLKGVANKKLVQGSSVNWTAFIPPSDAEVKNGWKESSINWEDDEKAVELLKTQEKNGELQFRAGVIRLPREKVDETINLFDVHDLLSYERKPLINNPYHGNLLFSENIKSEIRNTICGVLCGHARFV